MNRFIEKCDSLLMTIAPVLAGLAMTAYGLHSIINNQQYDNQVIWYAWDLLKVHSFSELLTFLGASHKYPIGYILPFAGVYKVAVWAIKDFGDFHQYLLGRLITLVWTLGTFLTLYRIERRYNWEAVILLASSLLFLIFGSAIRPHGPVAFWTLLSALCAFHAAQKNSKGWLAGSVISAFMATITLHSGLLAFVFPSWVLLRQRTWKEMIVPILLIGTAVLLSLIAGYWQIFANFGGVLHGRVVGHEGVTLSFDILKPFKLLPFFIGSDLILFAFAGYALWKRKTLLQDTPYIPIVIYLVLFYITFGFQPISAGRFFLATFPFLAMLGAPAFAQCSRSLRVGILLFLCIAWIKFFALALTPNTYQQVGAFITPFPGKFASIGQPTYFFPIDESRAAQTEEDVRQLQYMIIPDYMKKIHPPEGWNPCLHATSSPLTDENVLMWNDTPWAYANLFAAKAFGPSMKVYCVQE